MTTYQIADPHSTEPYYLIGPDRAELEKLSKEFLETCGKKRTQYSIDFAEWLEAEKGWTPLKSESHCFVDNRS